MDGYFVVVYAVSHLKQLVGCYIDAAKLFWEFHMSTRSNKMLQQVCCAMLPSASEVTLKFALLPHDYVARERLGLLGYLRKLS